MRICVDQDSTWEYIKPAPLNQKIQLLTKDNQCVVGVFKGDPLPHNKTYKGWKGLPNRDQDLERKLGYL
jgi:hypothetical protein